MACKSSRGRGSGSGRTRRNICYTRRRRLRIDGSLDRSQAVASAAATGVALTAAFLVVALVEQVEDGLGAAKAAVVMAVQLGAVV